MKEYIEKEAAKWHLYKEFIEDKQIACKVFRVLKSIPTIDVVEVRHGRWIRTDGIAHGIVSRVYSCSLCKRNAGVSENGFWYLSDYCPNCGAKMTEV